MDRYLAKEIILPFLFGIVAFSSLGLAAGVLFDIVRQMTNAGLPLSLALQIVSLKAPLFVALSFPMSTLLATLVTYGRFSNDSEFIAMRACGISVYRIVFPAIVISLLVTGVMFAFNESIAPAANYQAGVTLDRALNQEKPPFQSDNILFQQFGTSQGGGKQLKRLFYARKFNGSQMEDITVLDFSQDGLSQIVSAQTASWDIAQNNWIFSNGTIYVVSPDGSFRNIVKFTREEISLPRTPLDLAARGRDDDEMNLVESIEYLNLLRQGGDEKEIRKWRVRIQQKIALPFVCVVFGLVGSSLGCYRQRTGRATSFGMSLLIIFTYYLFAFIASAMGEVGALSPFLSAWIPNVVTLCFGILFLFRASR